MGDVSTARFGWAESRVMVSIAPASSHGADECAKKKSRKIKNAVMPITTASVTCFATFGETARAVVLGFFADEEGRATRHLRKHRCNRDAAHFETRERISVRRDERQQVLRDGVKDNRVALKTIFVEIFAAGRTRAQAKRTREVRHIVNLAGEF